MEEEDEGFEEKEDLKWTLMRKRGNKWAVFLTYREEFLYLTLRHVSPRWRDSLVFARSRFCPTFLPPLRVANAMKSAIKASRNLN